MRTDIPFKPHPSPAGVSSCSEAGLRCLSLPFLSLPLDSLIPLCPTKEEKKWKKKGHQEQWLPRASTKPNNSPGGIKMKSQRVAVPL